jgi:hypothetical protein
VANIASSAAKYNANAALSPGVPNAPIGINKPMRKEACGCKLSAGEILTPARRDEPPIQAITGETTAIRSEWR